MATRQQAKNKAKITGEVETIDEVVETVGTAVSTMALPAGMKLKKVITVPSLVMKVIGQAHTLKITSPFRESKVKGKAGEGPATICDVTDHETGQAMILLAPSVVLKNLQDEYPNDTYVGKSFYIQNLGKRKPAQRYTDYGIAEVGME